MAAYNACQYLNTSINSILDQSYEDWELLIINDGSTDETEKFIKKFRDPRLKYFYQKNQGVSMARNVGLRHMSGEFFCFLDADDYLTPESLSSRLEILEKKQNYHFVDGKVNIYNQDLQKINSRWSPSFRGNPINELLTISNSCFFGLSWMIRRDKKRIYQFHENLTHGEDLLFFIELALNGGKYDYTDEVILHYRKGHRSAMKNLKGLEAGYHFIYNLIKGKKEISHNKVITFKKKARNIIFKSYLGHLQPDNAILALFKKW